MEFEQEENRPLVTTIAPLYNAKHVRIGTFLGGPLLAGYFMAENYKVFGDYKKAKAAWMYAIIATLLIFGGLFLLPQSAQIPNYIIPLVYCWIAYYLVQNLQGAEITAYAESGKPFFGWGRVILISLIGLAVTFVFLVIGVLIFGDKVS